MHLQEVSFDHIAKIFVKFYPLTTLITPEFLRTFGFRP